MKRTHGIWGLLACGAFLLGAAGSARALEAGAPGSPFAIRGIKGLWWPGIENYRKALPWLAAQRLNFLMLCYTSFPASGKEWRADYTPEETAQLRDLAKQADGLGVNLCLSFNPGIWSEPPLVYSSERDYQLAWRKVKTVHGLGIRWFALCLDDINRALEPADRQRYKTLQAAQVAFVNRLWRDMKTLEPRPRLLFCPSAYTTQDARKHLDYIRTIGAGMDPEIMMFWTGPDVCSPSITAADAREYGAWIRRKPFVWDNYPVNDMYPWRPLVGPVKGRSADLAGAVSGYMANPMKQWEASRIPLGTLALYLNDPRSYQPQAAIEQVMSSYPKDQQRAIRPLVELYGSSFWGDPTFPPMPRPSNREAAARLLPRYRLLRDRLSGNPALSGLWEDVRPTLEDDIDTLERMTRDREKDSPLRARGDEFEGGAGKVYGYRKYERHVNYVYARSTGDDTMGVDFFLKSVPAAGATLSLTARDDDSGKKLRVRITLNDAVLLEGDSPFTSEGFTTREFTIPAAALKTGANRLVVQNFEPSGPLGMPPWFMVSEAALLPR